MGVNNSFVSLNEKADYVGHRDDDDLDRLNAACREVDFKHSG